MISETKVIGYPLANNSSTSGSTTKGDRTLTALNVHVKLGPVTSSHRERVNKRVALLIGDGDGASNRAKEAAEARTREGGRTVSTERNGITVLH
jgi:hypothetical protein